MVLKVMVMVMLVVVLWQGAATGDYCSTYLTENLPPCSVPQKTMVQVPVPKGYDYVIPRFVQLKRCTGLECPVYNTKCSPVKTKDMQFKVKSYKEKKEGEKEYDYNCKKVVLEEHRACECECDKECSHNEMLVSENCTCACKEEIEDRCTALNQKLEAVLKSEGKGGLAMWSGKTCSCTCDGMDECDYGEEWSMDHCQCVNDMP